MKCPLTLITIPPHSANVIYAAQDCLEEDCAWWRQEANQCYIGVIGLSLLSIEGSLVEIERKMPHEEQFRK